MDTDTNANVEALREVLQSNRQTVVFVGAGASIPLGIKGWDELLKDFAATYKIDLDVEECIKTKGYPGTASEIYKLIGDHDKYLTFMSSQFQPRNCRYTSLHETLMEKFKVILTTNYDAAFESYCGMRGHSVEIQKLPNFNALTLFDQSRQSTIAYLHGNNDEKKYIFRKEEYESYYPSISGKVGSKELESFLRTVVSNANLIFIGFSFKDDYLVQFLFEVIKEKPREREIHRQIFKEGNPKPDLCHFVIISEKEEKVIEELRMIDAFRVITYPDAFHVRIEQILESVMPSSIGSLEEEAPNAK